MLTKQILIDIEHKIEWLSEYSRYTIEDYYFEDGKLEYSYDNGHDFINVSIEVDVLNLSFHKFKKHYLDIEKRRVNMCKLYAERVKLQDRWNKRIHQVELIKDIEKSNKVSEFNNLLLSFFEEKMGGDIDGISINDLKIKYINGNYGNISNSKI